MTPRLSLGLPALGCLLLLAGCPKRSDTVKPVHHATADERAQQVALAPRVQKLAEGAKAVLHAQDELVWKSWTEGAGGDLSKAYEGHPDLFTPDAVQKVDRLRTLSSAPRDVRALTYLKDYLVGEIVAQRTADPSNTVANLEASMTFTSEGHDYAYRELDRTLASEKSAERRHALYAAATPSVDRVSQSLVTRNQSVREQLKALGYPSDEAFGAELRQAEFTALSGVAEQVLSLTQGAYRQQLVRLAATDNAGPAAGLQRADLPRLFRPSKDVETYFPKAELVPRSLGTLKSMGLDVSALPNVRLDFKDSPKRSPRALTLGVDIPRDVRVSVKLLGGARDQRAVLHELGHAVHDAFTTETRFELAQLGTGVVAEVYGNLFEGLAVNPIWLEENTGLSGQKLASYLTASNAQRLYLLRRSAGKLLYQVQLGRLTDGEGGKALFSSIVGRAEGITPSAADSARWVLEQEDFYASADHLRAWLLAGQLEHVLASRFGAAWWKSADAGTFLKQLAAPGNGLTAEELAQRLGADGIHAEPLVEQLTASLPLAPPPPPAKPPVTPALDGGT